MSSVANITLDYVRSRMAKTSVSFQIGEACPITVAECPDLDKAFDDTNLNLSILERGEVVSCIGCLLDRDEERIHISAACSAVSSRKKGFGSLIQLILFCYAKDENIRYITADTNSKSRPLMEKYLNAKCSDDYIPPFYDNNCIVDLEDTQTNEVVLRNINTIMARMKSKPKTRRIRSRTKSANDAMRSRSTRSRSTRSRSTRSRSKRSRSATKRSRSTRSRSTRSRSTRSRSTRSRSTRSRSTRSRSTPS
jgi:hypothetical protein